MVCSCGSLVKGRVGGGMLGSKVGEIVGRLSTYRVYD